MENSEMYMDVSEWKDELSQNGYILCTKPSCGMGFLSIKGMEVHYKNCTGEVIDGDFVPCPICKVRFKTFMIMERHKIKTHQSVIDSRKDISKPIVAATTSTPNLNRSSYSIPPSASPISYQKRATPVEISSSGTGNMSPIMDVSNVFGQMSQAVSNLDVVHLNESRDEQNRRIFAESRLMYTGRRPGRPPKANNNALKKLPKPPMICRQSTSDSNNEDSSLSMALTPINFEKAMRDREKELIQREAQLKAYQEQVIKVEKLAEDATRIALEEKEMRLRKLAEELRNREAIAKEKLANAVQSMEILKSKAPDLPSTSEFTKVSTKHGSTNEVVKKAPEATFTEPEEEEDEEITESQHPNQNQNVEIEDSVEIEKNKVESRKDQQFILPDEKFREMEEEEEGEEEENPPKENEKISAEIINRSHATLVQDTKDTITGTVDTAGGGTMLVLNENDQLQSLLAKAQRGEITLVAQPCGDGNYILQESIENEQQQQSSSEYIAHATTSSVGNLTKNASTTIQASKEVITAEITDEYQVENMADENIAEHPPPNIVEAAQKISDNRINEEIIAAKSETDHQNITQKGAKRRKRNSSGINQILPSRRSSRHVIAGTSNVDLHSDTPSQDKQTADIIEENVSNEEESNFTKIKEKDGVVEEQLKELEVEEKTSEDPGNSEMESTETEIIPTKKISNLVVSSENVTMEIITDIEHQPKPKITRRGRKRTKNNSNNEEIATITNNETTDTNSTNHGRPDHPALDTNDSSSKTIVKCEDIISAEKIVSVDHQENENKIVPPAIGKRNPRRGRPPKITDANTETTTLVDEIDINEKLTDLDEQKTTDPSPKKKGRRGRPKSSSHSSEDTQMICSICDLALTGEKMFKLHVAQQHGGIAFVKGQEKLDISDNELNNMLKDAFAVAKKEIPCYKCLNKTFGSLPGLKYHLKTCSKTTEELELLKEKCQYCPFSTLSKPYFKEHLQRCSQAPGNKVEISEPMEVEEEEDPLDVTNSGRKKRKSAKRASKRMSDVIEMVRDDVIDRNDDSDDEFKIRAKDLEAEDPDDFGEDEDEELIDPNSPLESENGDDVDQEDISPRVKKIQKGKTIKPYKPGYKPRPKQLAGNGSIESLLDKKMKIKELNYQRSSYFKNSFKDIQIIEEMEEVDSIENFLPNNKSVMFEFNNGHNLKFAPFETIQQDVNRWSFNAGGPIQSSAWCPQTLGNRDVLALIAGIDFDFDPPKKSFIQFWTFNSGSLEFAGGLALNYKINCMKWCPSLNNEEEVTDEPKFQDRLGLLAVACSDGCVRILAISKKMFESSEPKIFMAKYSFTLKRSSNTSIACLKIDWFKGPGHRLIAGSFTDGTVALWDLITKSPLLKAADGLFPLKSFHAHEPGSRPTLVLSQDLQSWPMYLVTGGFDRKLIVWNLDQPDEPSIEEEHECLAVTNLEWAANYSNHHFIVTFDDAYTIGNIRTTIYEIGNRQHLGFLIHNSSCQSVSHSPWFNVTIVGNNAGEITMFIGFDSDHDVVGKDSKHFQKRKTILYRSTMSNAKLSDPEFLKTYEELTDHYNEDLKVEILDRNLKKLGFLSETELAILKEREGPAFEDLRKYPLLSVKRVEFSPNQNSRSWIFTGLQSGLCRLIRVPDFK